MERAKEIELLLLACGGSLRAWTLLVKRAPGQELDRRSCKISVKKGQQHGRNEIRGQGQPSVWGRSEGGDAVRTAAIED